MFFTALRNEAREGYRVPRRRIFSTPNNPGTQAGVLQEKEWQLAAWAHSHRIPSVSVHELLEVDGFPILACEVVPDDGSAMDGSKLGALLAAMHRAPLPESLAAGNPPEKLGRRLAQRMRHRYQSLAATRELPRLPEEPRLAAALEGQLRPSVLAHLDVRRQNVRISGGEPVALFDWSNALPAPPELEIARIGEYSLIEDNGLDFAGICSGYALAGGRVETSTRIWPLLQLDAALMLAVVFDAVAPDERLRAVFLDRVRLLLSQLEIG